MDDGSSARLAAFLASVVDIDVQPEIDDLAALAEQPRIDAGEAVLFLACPLLPGSLLVTGDKRSLAGLQEASESDPACARIRDRLRGKVYCFELILERILATVGFEAIRDRLVRGRECDGGLALWVGSGLNTTEQSFQEGLASYLSEARRTTGTMLAP